MALVKKGRQKSKFCGCLVVIGRTKDIKETKITSNLLIQFVYQETF